MAFQATVSPGPDCLTMQGQPAAAPNLGEKPDCLAWLALKVMIYPPPPLCIPLNQDLKALTRSESGSQSSGPGASLSLDLVSAPSFKSHMT